MSEKASYNDLRWEVRQRLKFIETRLFWEGKINRRNIVDYFGISGVQATNDFARYTDLAPQNLKYDGSRKCYVASDIFEPVLIRPEAEALLYSEDPESKILNAGLPWAGLPVIHRHIDYKIFRKVLRSTQERASLEIRYQSMSKPESSWRWISPHAFAHDGLRWHVRAYCFIDNKFKDFLLARVLEIKTERPGFIFQQEDTEWVSTVNLEIAPHSELSEGQKKVIETDYGMDGGVLVAPVRQALLPYFLQRYNLIDERPRPEDQQIILSNKDEVLLSLKPETTNRA